MAKSNESQELDIWDKALEDQIEILQKCQTEKALDSCFICNYLLECLTRKAYIKSVYESMNKGTGGGFEF